MACYVMCSASSADGRWQLLESVAICRAEALSLAEDISSTQLKMDSVEVVKKQEGLLEVP